MKDRTVLSCLIAGLALAGAQSLLRAGDDTNQPPRRPGPQPLREQLRNLTPEERQAKVKEWREKHSLTNRPAVGPREERGTLTPEQRDKIKALREGRAANSTPLKNPAEDQRRTRLKTKLAELQKKKADGTSTPEEDKLIKYLEQAVQRFDKSGDKSGSGPKPPAEKP